MFSIAVRHRFMCAQRIASSIIRVERTDPARGAVRVFVRFNILRFKDFLTISCAEGAQPCG